MARTQHVLGSGSMATARHVHVRYIVLTVALWTATVAHAGSAYGATPAPYARSVASSPGTARWSGPTPSQPAGPGSAANGESGRHRAGTDQPGPAESGGPGHGGGA